MGGRARSRLWLAALLSVSAGLVAVWPATRWTLWRWEQNPILRGRLLAEAQGCLSCHVPYRGTEIPNPGSRWGSVPRFQAGNAMMYGETRREIEEFIRFGAPESWRSDPDAAARLAQQQIRMPAYDAVLSDAEISDLVAFACAMEGLELPRGAEVDAGRQLARAHGCLSCHGVEGSGGLPNPGSLGGFVPGFVGKNFDDLVRDEAEFREWVRDGTSSRLAGNPIVRYFWNRQRLEMPAYGDQLDDDELHQLWLWIQAIRTEVGVG